MAQSETSRYPSQIHGFCDSDVLLIGDSHTLLSDVPRSFPDYDVDAESGRGSAQALNVLDQYLQPRHRIVVFDLATNDHAEPARCKANLELFRDQVGSRRLVVVNCWRQDDPNTHLRVNRVLRRFADHHRRKVTLVDWASYLDLHPESLGQNPDRVHFTERAYRRRAAMVRAAVNFSARRLPRVGLGLSVVEARRPQQLRFWRSRMSPLGPGDPAS